MTTQVNGLENACARDHKTIDDQSSPKFMKAQQSQRLKREVNQFLKAYPDLTQFEVLVTDICGHYFGKRYPIDKLASFAAEGLAMPASMFTLSTLGEPLDGLYYGIDDGDPDAHFYLVPGSLCLNDWGREARAQVVATTCDGDQPSWFEPRYVLQKVVDAYAARHWRPMVAFELEFYLFAAQRDADDLLQIVRNPKTGRKDTATVLSSARIGDFETVIDDIIHACEMQNIDTGAISAELGPGQFEINFNHHADVLRAADETCLFKRIVVEIAKKHGMGASFIAKPLLAFAGNGLHMHISVVDDQGKNIFAGPRKGHARLYHAIGGLLATMPAAMSFWAPNINSYRRYRGGTSCAPVSLTWGNENRTVAFRIPHAKEGAWRVENRVPGADANPYLAMAVTLAGMLHGIQNKLDPGEATDQAVVGRDESLPLDMRTALARTLDSVELSDIMGREFIELYCRHRAAETTAFENHINAREYDWYL
ncbi:MAG: glutamine synthetase family protein [Gammaproteobacteria bacterium]|nr:glutamine synthetase family protein [Gammaproteobacteria bacterium]